MGPLEITQQFSPATSLLIALLIGIAFGFVLEQAGFSSSRKLAGMFYGYDTTVIKVFFTAAITALLGVLLLNYMGLLDMSLVYINPFYLKPIIIGGLVMGAGFIMGGFCPGTSFCAAAIGKIDAIFFIVGGFIGALIFTQAYSLWSNLYTSTYMGELKISDSLGLSDGLFALILVFFALIVFKLSEMAEKKFALTDDSI